MGFASSFAHLQNAMMEMTKKPVSSFSSLETTDDSQTIVCKDGSLLSLIKVDGIKQVMGQEELENVVDRLSVQLKSFFEAPGHAMQVWFTRDPDLSAQMIKTQTEPARLVAASLGLELDDLFDEREKVLPKFVVYESYYIGMWTRLSALTKQELHRAKVGMKPPPAWPQMGDAQNPFRAAVPLRDRHRSFVANMISNLKMVHIRSEVMKVHDAVNAIRGSVYPDLVDADWKPYLIGDPIPVRHAEINNHDASHLFWPRLDDQIFSQEAERINPRIVRIGSRNFAGVDMTIGPMELQPFSILLNRMIDTKEFPWRVSFLIEGGGLNGQSMKEFMASIFTLTNAENKAVRDAIRELKRVRAEESVIVTKLRVSFATWGPAGDLQTIEERASRLQRAIESWGYCSVSATTGDPLQGAMSSALALSPASTAPAGAVPLEAVVSMLPLNRDASPWDSGSIMFRTQDGRVWPFAPGTDKQKAFIDLIYAPPGYGKSVYLNTANLALALSPMSTAGSGGSKLPRIAIIDIGPSSSGFISLLKEALPPHRRHEAEHHRLRMVKEHAINVFDTQLGCRQPFPMERSFLVNFLTALGTPVGDQDIPSGLAEIAGFCIDELYKMKSDEYPKSTPERYLPDLDIEVDEAVRRHNVQVDRNTIWWQLVDDLYSAGDEHAASLAQRYAVPRLQDLGLVLNSPKIVDLFSSARSKSGEPTLKLFERMYISALAEFPLLTMPTKFDIGESRVVALDLDEVCPRGEGIAEKQTGLMYMLARFVLAKDFYLVEDLLDAKNDGRRMIPDLYRSHHDLRIRRIKETPKRLVYDEFHRTEKTPSVRSQVLIDIREGRKFGVHIALASQSLADFSPLMIEMATGIWIMGSGNERATQEAKQVFSLSETATWILRRNLNGPSRVGAPFLTILKLEDGQHEHFLYNTIGPTELWAFSTTAEDAALRNRLYARLGSRKTRARLARAYPTGSIKGEIQRRVKTMVERGMRTEGVGDGVITQIFDEVVAMRDD